MDAVKSLEREMKRLEAMHRAALSEFSRESTEAVDVRELDVAGARYVAKATPVARAAARIESRAALVRGADAVAMRADRLLEEMLDCFDPEEAPPELAIN